MFEYTEMEMADAFSEAIKNRSVTRLPLFDCVFREVMCPQGIADFVGLTSDGLLSKYRFDRLSSIENCSRILSILKLHSGRHIEYVSLQTGLPILTLNRLLKEMESNKYIKRSGDLFYRCIPDVSTQTSAWAFELKLNNWKRAIFQALQYKAFANYSIVVFPYEKKAVIESNLHYFKELNIGVLLFDVYTRQSRWVFFPLKDRPISKWHTFFLLGKIISVSSDDNIMT